MQAYLSEDRNLALDSVRVTEAAALASARLMGRGDEKAADQAAVDAMRQALNVLDIEGTVVIGEGERDEAPMLYIGERVGTGRGPKIDIALDPLEGTTIAAKGGSNAISCLAMAPAGGFLNAPDVYMEKIAVGGGLPPGTVRIEDAPAANLARLAEAKGVPVSELVVLILDRPRHEQLIRAVRAAGARIRLISDGDVAGVIATARPGAGIDIYMGSGGAPEGVLAAAALRSIGGQFEGKLLFRNDDERARARHWGVRDLDRVYGLEDLAKGDVMFTATGVTEGTMLKGVRRVGDKVYTQSIVMRSKTGTVRFIETEHNLPLKSGVVPFFQP
jgi:fructose-1,6-bisphosphatase II / sedoheptulose-1,7-bisphosphatase